MFSRRGFLLGLVALPAAAEQTMTIPCHLASGGEIVIRPEDKDRAMHTGQLVNLLLADIEDMGKGISNYGRPAQEDHLYAKIQADRKW